MDVFFACGPIAGLLVSCSMLTVPKGVMKVCKPYREGRYSEPRQISVQKLITPRLSVRGGAKKCDVLLTDFLDGRLLLFAARWLEE